MADTLNGNWRWRDRTGSGHTVTVFFTVEDGAIRKSDWVPDFFKKWAGKSMQDLLDAENDAVESERLMPTG